MRDPSLTFDREVSLSEMLKAIPQTELQRILTLTVGDRWQIVDTDDSHILGPAKDLAQHESMAATLQLDFEAVGKLVIQREFAQRIEIAKEWLEMLLSVSSRYRMAADLHLEAIHSDFEALQCQHEALKESEERYRVLTEQLDARVQSQVALIEQTQRQLYQTEKLASIGSLAAGVAHEINNPIGFIRSNLCTAARYVEAIDKVIKAIRETGGDLQHVSRTTADIEFLMEDFPVLLAESINGADRIKNIVDNLKAFSSIDNESKSVSDMNEIIRSVAAVVRDQLSSDMSLQLNLRPLPNITVDRGRISQAILAILQNAQQAMRISGGYILVSSHMTDDEIVVAIHDTGAGIKRDIFDRIFDPFFTTRDVGDGAGLGLTVSRDIVLAHHGRLEVKSEEGRGSTFTLILPFTSKEGQVEGLG